MKIHHISQKQYASYLLGNNDNFIKKDSISNFNLKGAKFPSKLFPGVFFDQPIDKDNLIQEENNNNFNWDMVIIIIKILLLLLFKYYLKSKIFLI